MDRAGRHARGDLAGVAGAWLDLARRNLAPPERDPILSRTATEPICRSVDLRDAPTTGAGTASC